MFVAWMLLLNAYIRFDMLFSGWCALHQPACLLACVLQNLDSEVFIYIIIADLSQAVRAC